MHILGPEKLKESMRMQMFAHWIQINCYFPHITVVSNTAMLSYLTFIYTGG